jgi:hypothetical protein
MPAAITRMDILPDGITFPAQAVKYLMTNSVKNIDMAAFLTNKRVE